MTHGRNSLPPVWGAGLGFGCDAGGADCSRENSDALPVSAEEIGTDSWARGPVPWLGSDERPADERRGVRDGGGGGGASVGAGVWIATTSR